MVRLFFVGITILLFCFSCSSIKPQKPEIVVEEYVAPPKVLSSIYVPLEINLKPIFSQLESEAPTKMNGAESQCEGVSYSYRFERSPIQFSGKNDVLTFTVDGRYALKVNYCPKCTDFYKATSTTCIIPRVYLSCGEGEPMRRLRLSFDTKLNVTSDYKIHSKTSLASVKTIDPCEVSFVNYDASDQVLKEVEKSLKDLAKDLDKQIQNTQIKKEIEGVWIMLNRTISLGEFGFLSIQPKRIFVSEPKFSNQNLSIHVGLEAEPFISSHKPNTVFQNLPELSKETKDKGFSVNLDLISSYDSINSMLNRNFKNLHLDFKGKKFIINNITVFGAANEKLLFEIDFSGSKSGKLFLVGTPFFNNETSTIFFKDVHFDVKTKDILIKSAKWLFNDKITRLIEEKATYSFTMEVADIKKKLNLELNKQVTKEIKLMGNLNSIEVVKIFPTENQLLIETRLKGDLNLRIF